MFRGHRRLNLALPFLASALLLVTACSTMELGAQQASVQEDEPASEWAHTEPTTLSDQEL